MNGHEELSGRMARLAARLPRPGRMIYAFLVLLLAFAVVVGFSWAVEDHVGKLGARILVTLMALIGVMIGCLVMLAQWRVVAKRLSSMGKAPENLPAFWRIPLLLYNKEDIETMQSKGRLAELLVLPFYMIIAAGFVYLSLTVPHRSYAKENTMTELRTTIQATRADIERDYVRQNFPSEHPPFSFSILMPRDWLWFEKEGRPTEPNGKPQLLIAYGDKSDQSLVEILGFQIQREMAPADWLQEWMRINGYEVQASRVVPAATGRNLDVKASKKVNGRSVTFRIRTFKDGDYIYILHCFSDADRYRQVEDTFLVAAESFNLTNPTGRHYAEPVQDLPLNKVFDVGFKMPTSWTAKPDTGVDPDCQSWSIFNNLDGKAIGVVNVYAAPRHRFQDAASVAAMSTRWLNGMGVDYAGAPLKDVDSGMARISVAVTDQKVTINGSPGVIRQTVVGTQRGWVVFTLASKTLDPDPYLIAVINRRAHDIAFGSFLSALMST